MMRVTKREIRVGWSGKRGWLVSINGNIVAILQQDTDDGSIFLAYGLADPWAAEWGPSWNALDDALVEFRSVAEHASRGVSMIGSQFDFTQSDDAAA